MATCATCGAAILWKRLEGVALAVDVHESTTGVGRFVERDGDLVPIKVDAQVMAFVGHRQTCSPRRRAA